MKDFKDYLDKMIKGEKMDEMAAGYTSNEFLANLFQAVADGEITPKEAMEAVQREKAEPSARTKAEMKRRAEYAQKTGGGCLY